MCVCDVYVHSSDLQHAEQQTVIIRNEQIVSIAFSNIKRPCAIRHLEPRALS